MVLEKAEIGRKTHEGAENRVLRGRLIDWRGVWLYADVCVGSVAGIEYIVGGKVSLQADVSFADTALESGGGVVRSTGLCTATTVEELTVKPEYEERSQTGDVHTGTFRPALGRAVRGTAAGDLG